MKPYFLFSSQGSDVKIQKNDRNNLYSIELNGSSTAYFTKEKLLQELELLKNFIEKYDKDIK